MGYSRATFHSFNRNVNQKNYLMNTIDGLSLCPGGSVRPRRLRVSCRRGAAPFPFHAGHSAGGALPLRFAAETTFTFTVHSWLGVAQILFGSERPSCRAETSSCGDETPAAGAETLSLYVAESSLHTEELFRGAAESFFGTETSSCDAKTSSFGTEYSLFRAGKDRKHTDKPLFDKGFYQKVSTASLNRLGTVNPANH